ncbi:phosphodiester glycosidase family protein [Paenibacillus taiwanensis]|uniref:phosphodiester glycosidase family protein n=1 Tax=Paenibacillus taiwanensis TaxID=401638 RepID=UPI0004217796
MPAPAAPDNQKQKKKKSKGARKRAIWKIIRVWMAIFMLCITFGAGWLLFTPSGEQFRFMIADTLLTTRHRHWAKFIIGEKETNRRIQQYNNRFEQMGDEQANTNLIKTPAQPKNDKPLTELKEISGQGYSGYLLTIQDPKSIRVAVTNEMGMGEKVSTMVKRTGARFGINGGGFADPNWKGNGFQPIGIVYADGKLFYNGIGKNKRTQIVGFDKEGKMVAGNYTVSQMEELGVKEAVSFQPRIIVNGKGLIKNAADGWGIAPRTVIGQKEDGTVLFLVIDGRQTHSIGANLYDCQQLMLEHGAVIAANLDGGSSTVLVGEGGKLVNSPASQYGERLLPTAFLVFDHPDKAIIKNIWEGLDPTKIDPSTWKRHS